MKHGIIMLLAVCLLSSCQDDQTRKFLYTETEFEKRTGIDPGDSNDALKAKRARTSHVYEVEFVDRDNYSQTLLLESAEEIVYHDFCSFGGRRYALGGRFGEHYDTAIMQQAYPPAVDNVVLTGSEIRFRDCDYITQDGNNYLGVISHGVGNFYLYDADTWDLLDTKKSSYEGLINEEAYKDITMIHEVIAADADGDGREEFYYTPSSKNGPSHIDQRGYIYRADVIDGKTEIQKILDLGDAYAKEIHPLTLKNNQKILLVSVQGKTQVDEEKFETQKAKVRFAFKDGTTKEIKDINSSSELIRPTLLHVLYYEGDELKTQELGEIDSLQCRALEQANIYDDEKNITIVLGCKNGGIYLYTLSETFELDLKQSFMIPKKQVLSLHISNTDTDPYDEIFVGASHDGVYHLDMQAEIPLFKLFDYSQTENWIWSMEGMN